MPVVMTRKDFRSDTQMDEEVSTFGKKDGSEELFHSEREAIHSPKHLCAGRSLTNIDVKLDIYLPIRFTLGFQLRRI